MANRYQRTKGKSRGKFQVVAGRDEMRAKAYSPPAPCPLRGLISTVWQNLTCRRVVPQL
jgi:hypothetical protein